MSDRLRRWLSWATVALVVALACTFLGRWQYHRYEAKANAVALVQENFNAQQASLDDVISPTGFQPQTEWSPVSLRGQFIGENVILPQRGVPGQAGDHVLSLFVTSEAEPRTVVVDRGWYPVNHPPQTLEPPVEEVTIVARVRPAENESPRGVRDHQVFVVDPLQVLQAQPSVETPTLLATVYFMADVEAPGQTNLGSFPEPAANLGNHLSYAFQWWSFGVGALVGLGVVIYRDIKHGTGVTPRPKRRIGIDAAEEDALIDAQFGSEQ